MRTNVTPTFEVLLRHSGGKSRKRKSLAAILATIIVICVVAGGAFLIWFYKEAIFETKHSDAIRANQSSSDAVTFTKYDWNKWKNNDGE